MKKKYFIFAASALALASCSSDDFVGDNPGGQPKSDVINFDGATGKTTRANLTGDGAATKLDKKFVVYGWKNTADKVYDHYNVVWNNKAGQTQSNTAGWEYVGQTKNTLNESAGDQSIKYWDYSANQYDFVAFSFGTATQGDAENQVKASKVDAATPKYTLTGKAEELVKCYIADRVSARKNVSEGDKKANKLVSFGDAVQFNFRSLASKVKMGIYEIVPGYSIKDVKFYKNGTETTPSATGATLFAATSTIPDMTKNGTMTITFGSNDAAQTDFNQAKVAWDNVNNVSTIGFDALSMADKEQAEEDGQYIGRTVATASQPTDYNTVLPAEVGALTLKVDYTLVSTDGSGEIINVKGATAVVPAEFTNWKSNYAYTYIFKISDKTNGMTGTETDPKGLYPITFDAVVTETTEGLQNTITTVNSPAITTYALGAQNEEYKVNQNIYVALSNGNMDADNTALYTAVKDNGTAPITEAYVALCLKDKTGDGPWSLDDGTNKLTVTSATGLSIETEIAGADVADGNKITGNFAKFTPNAAGTYVFEYTTTVTEDGTAKTVKYYKVIKVTK